MSFSVIIPARFASSRLPGKPLLDIAGKPMIQHVYERAKASDAARVVIATDDQRIVEAGNGFGAEVVMTDTSHESGTDRLQQVASILALPKDHIIVNVQGDEPLIPARVINQVAENLQNNQSSGIATLIEAIEDYETVMDPNAVKVVRGEDGNALYFSRAPIPWDRDHFAQQQTLPNTHHFFRHIGIYAYRVQFLHDFVQWPIGALEAIEKLEQLRALEHGVKIHTAQSLEAIPAGVDTQTDLDTVRSIFNTAS